MEALNVLLRAVFTGICIQYIQCNENIAFKKMTKQSSVDTDQEFKGMRTSKAAVDGHVHPSWINSKKDFVCTHTRDGDTMPWWAVYLGGVYSVSGVTVYGRDDCCLKHTSKITIEVIRPSKCWCDIWEVLHNPTAIVQTIHYQEVGVRVLNISCQPDTIGGFVKIRRNGETLSICEVEVYGDLVVDEIEKTVTPDNTKNLYSACKLNDMKYNGPMTTTITARSNIECVSRCVTRYPECKVAAFRGDSKTCIYTAQDCANVTTKSEKGDHPNNVFIIQ